MRRTRQAGTKAAIVPAAAITSDSVTNVVASSGVTPNNWLASACVESAPATAPATIPMAIGTSARATTDAFLDRNPRWSPDGSRIAFYSNRTGHYEVWTITPDNQVNQLTAVRDVAATPLWSPDGTRLAFSNVRKARVSVIDPRRAWDAQQPEDLPPPPGPGIAFGPTAWMSDSVLLGTLGGRVASYDFSTKQYRVIEDLQGLSPVPVGQRILYANQRTIKLFDPASKRVSELIGARPGQTIGSPRVTRDGRTLYYPLLSTESDIWVAEIPKR